MGIENDLEKIFNLREKQAEIKDDAQNEKEIDALNAKTEKLLSKETKIGQKRMEAIMNEAEKENFFRDKINGLMQRLNIEIDSNFLKNQIENKRRYFTSVIEASLNGKAEKYFLKILKPNYKKEEFERDQNAFAREMQAMLFIKSNTDLPILKIEEGKTDPDFTYFLAETLPDAEIGFIKSMEDMKKLKPEHARQSILQLLKMSEVKLPENIDEEIEDLQDPFESYEGYRENVWNLLDNKEEPECTQVRPIDGKVDNNGEIKQEIFLDVLARRFGVKEKEMRSKVEELFERWRRVVEKYDEGEWVLTHGDLSPNNMYIGDDDNARFLDWEWAGKTKNKLLAIVYDYGNLRARAFNNPEFQEELDEAIIEEFKKNGDEEAGQAIVSLGIFRSSALLAGFFENYEPAKQELPEETERRELTEKCLTKAFEIANIDFPKKYKIIKTSYPHA